ncbi:MAG: MBL fold metallo-hydrolase [Candidatus Omnitrophica bacterium]|nr:MBL fold metallo-hydrolase [Candidatus Omnitrophota bacterium]
MISKLFCPGLLNTGFLSDKVMAVRDGIVNFYILKSPEGLICIDTGWRPACVSRAFKMLGLNIRNVAGVFLTHLHWDHARCLQMFPDAKVFVGECDNLSVLAKQLAPKQISKKVEDAQMLTIGGFTVRVVNTPGHTAGSVSYVVDQTLLFTGDTLCLKRGKVLPFPYGLKQDRKKLDQSIQNLARIKGVECLLTAHSGMSRDIKNAFSQWQEPADDLLPAGDKL